MLPAPGKLQITDVSGREGCILLSSVFVCAVSVFADTELVSPIY